MGTDIHLYFEKKNKDTGKWERIEVDERLIPDDRNSELFSFLVGMYNEHEYALFANRGIPRDSSFPNYFDNHEHLDTFSETYAYLDEILKAPWREAELQDSYFYIFCAYILPKLAHDYGIMSDEDKRNVRVIMGFDN